MHLFAFNRPVAFALALLITTTGRLVSASSIAVGSSPPLPVATNADQLWEWVLEPSHLPPPASSDLSARLAAAERRDLALRERGMVFAVRYPDDPRTGKWLNTTLLRSPRYFLDPEQGAAALAEGKCGPTLYDQPKIMAWDVTYAMLRARIFASKGMTATQRAHIEQSEFKSIASRLGCGQSVDMGQLLLRISDYVARTDRPADAAFLVAELYGALLRRHLTSESEALVATMKASPVAALQDWAEGQEKVADLRRQPLELKFTTQSGRPFDLSNYRGKIVLFDGWSIWCSGCVEALPKIKRIHDRYRAQGFEVVGICFVTNRDRDEAKSMKAIRLSGADWPIEMLYDSQAKAFLDHYGIQGMPVMWMLGADGRLQSNEFLDERELDARIRTMLHDQAAAVRHPAG